MKESLQKVLRQLLDEISDQKFADLVFRLFVSMPDTFHIARAWVKNPIPLAEHLVLTAVLALKKVKKWSKGRPKHIVLQMVDEVIIICLFHDFWKFDWTEDPPKRTNGMHGYVSGDKMSEFIKESRFSEEAKNRILGSIFFHMERRKKRRSVAIEGVSKNSRARRFLSGSDGKTYRIYENKTRLFDPKKVIKCIQDYK